MLDRMKRFALFSAAIALLNGRAVFCQDTPLCSMPDVPTQTDVLPLRHGGLYVSSTGVLRGLMIFVRFSDDVEAGSNWSNPEVLPEWAQRFVEPVHDPSGNYYTGTVSHYFFENSYGKFHVIGDVYYVTTDYDESYYHQYAYTHGASAARGLIETEVFNKLDGPQYRVDFRRYDNWAFGTFIHTYVPDSVLDMCWFMTRNLHDDNLPFGQAPFGIGWATLDCPSLTKDGVFIKGIDYFFPASGITIMGQLINRPLNSSEATGASYPTVNVMAHEMSHYLFGYNHFTLMRIPLAPRRYDSYCTSLVGGWQSQYSGYEKFRLTWLTPTVIDYNADPVVLNDLITTNDSTKIRLIKIPIPSTTQFFLIENRRWISPFEARYAQASDNPGRLKPGITVYLVVSESDFFAGTIVKKLDGDGMFTWKFLYRGSLPYEQRDDWIEKDLSNRVDGYNECERIFLPNGLAGEWWPAEFYPFPSNPYDGGPYRGTYFSNTSTITRDLDGDSLDTYQVGDVISPWSNPGSHYWNGTTATFSSTSIGVEVKSFNITTQAYTLAIRMSQPELLAPSKPQDLRLTLVDIGGGSTRPKVTWTGNSEPDVNPNGHYTLERRFKEEGMSWTPWGQIGPPLPGSATEYIDGEIVIEPTRGVDSLQYRIRASDTQGKFSVCSDVVSMRCNLTFNPPGKIQAGDNPRAVPSRFALYQNHPNPFNPSTQIKFDLPEAGSVSLAVYDVLGRKVVDLVSENREAGYYTATWNATNVSSGVYIAQLMVCNELSRVQFMKLNKLVLLK